MNELAAADWVAIAGALLAAGLVKGVIGFGLPLVAMAIMASLLNVGEALAYMTLPIVATNLWQAVQGGLFVAVLRRFWILILVLALGIALGASIAAGAHQGLLFLILGGVVLTYVGLELSRWQPKVPPARERILGAAFGLVAGVIGGITTAYGAVLVLYLNAIRLPKDQFVATVGVIWFSGSIFLLAGFGAVGILTWPRLLVSALAVVPALIGMWVGRRLRDRVDETRFRRLVLLAIFLVGLNLVRRGVS